MYRYKLKLPVLIEIVHISSHPNATRVHVFRKGLSVGFVSTECVRLYFDTFNFNYIHSYKANMPSKHV